MKVGFIGLGIMGKPMCRNLMKAGYEAVVYNRSKASVEELAAEGAQAAGSPAEVAENCQVIITIIMYNNKPKTNVTITPATVAKLADIENIVAVKDSTGDMTNAAEYIRLTRGKDFSVLMGRDTLIYAALCYGATGAIASCANVAPRIAADIYDKYVAGDLAGALEAQFTLAPFRIACGMGTFPAAIKEGLVQEGIPVGKCLDPIGELTPEEKEKLHKVLADMNLV